MWTQQVLVSVLCLFLAVRQINAVVNTGANAKESTSASSETNSDKTKEAVNTEITDSIAASSEKEADKREAVIDLTGVYGTPIDTYLPAATVNLDLPIPVYGVPNVGPNIIYPAPPPDVPPPLPAQYGVPNGLNLPAKEIYGPPKFSYGPPKYKPPRIKYGPPHHRPSHHPKPIYGPPRKPHFPKPLYGPPKHYGPPKPQYGPPKVHPPKPHYIPTIPQAPILSPPPLANGPPNINLPNINLPNINLPNINLPNVNLPIGNLPNVPPKVQPTKHYGPPEPVPHSPPPGVPAPPTPPDIKYDGWQPIPGLVSKPPQGAYGPPRQVPLPNHSNDLNINADFTPPQEGTVGIDSLGLQDNYKAGGVVSDSYGAPLNTVTGSGGVVQISGEAHHQQGHQENHNQGSTNYQQGSSNYQQGSLNYQQGSSNYQQGSSNHQQGSSSHHQDLNLGLSAVGLDGDNSLSVVKSVEYELQPGSPGSSSYASGFNTYTSGLDSYVSGLNPYTSGVGSHSSGLGSHASGFDSYSSGLDSYSSGLDSYSSGLDSYSSPPSNSFSPEGSYPASKGYKFTKTQFSSQGFEKVNAAFGTQHFSKDIGLIPPSGLYGATPNSQYGTPLFQPASQFKGPKRPVVFRDPVPSGFIHAGASESAYNQANGINTIQAAAYVSPSVQDVTKPVKEEINEPSNLYSLPHVDRPISFQNIVHGSSTAGLSSFNVLDTQQNSNGGGAYALPLQSSYQGNGVDFGTVGYSNGFGYQHDCNSHGSQPLPQFTYGVPSANTYTAALSSLKTNIGNVYGAQDLSASHSVKVASSNSISEAAKEVYAKSFGGSLASGGELIKSESLDLNSIPLQGALGSYTLQIQPADGLGGTDPSGSSGVPHEQVLNDGLLQSILAAIEQPHQQNLNINNNVPAVYSNGGIVNYDEVKSRSDQDIEASEKKPVVVSTENAKENKIADEKTEEDNEVAVYLKNDEAEEKNTNERLRHDLKPSNKDETSKKQ